MKKEILVSIIVPTYNVDELITRCLDSIINQSYKNLEIIIVDDGSTDKTREILNEYKNKDARIKVIHKENGGVTTARLTGVKEANGEWIGFVDGDDTIEKEMYDILLKNAIKFNSDISHCGYKMIFNDGRVNYFHNSKSLIIQDNFTGIKDLLEGNVIEPGVWNKLYKRRLFDNFEIDKTIKITEDLLMNYYLFKKSFSSVFDDRCLYNYIVRDSSVTHQKFNKNKVYDPIKVKEIILEDCNIKMKRYAKASFINTCVYIYCSLIKNKTISEKERNYVRSKVVNKRKWLNLATNKVKILGVLILYFPFLLDFVYPIYANLFQSKKYE